MTAGGAVKSGWSPVTEDAIHKDKPLHQIERGRR